MKECHKQWSNWFSHKETDKHTRDCCLQNKECECITDLPICKNGTNIDPQCRCMPLDDCVNNTISIDQCMTLPNTRGGNSSRFNWLWILLAVAIIIIIVVTIAICCVSKKKFSGKDDSRADTKHGQIKFGKTMNVDSKVHWKGKHRNKSSKKTSLTTTSKNNNKSKRIKYKSNKNKHSSIKSKNRKKSSSKNTNKSSKKNNIKANVGKHKTTKHQPPAKSARISRSGLVKAVS